MALVMLAIGSRGDVQPMGVLAAALARAGVDVRVVGLAEYADLAAAPGVGFVPVAARLADAHQRVQTRTGRLVASNPVGQAFVLRRWLAEITAPVADAVLASVNDGDTVLTGVLSRDVATALATARRGRAATLLFTGQVPTRHRESHFGGPRYTRSTRWNLATSRLAWSVGSTLGSPLGDEVRRRLGLPPVGRRVATSLADRHPVIVAASPVVVPPARDWPTTVHQTGYLAPADVPYDPPPALASFLAGGPAPVYLGFGSMVGGLGHEVVDNVLETARLTGLRFVTPAPDGDAPGPVGDDVLTIAGTPHPWLFPRMAAVVHHGGAGTTHAGLRSGVPSSAVPFGVDQPYHAWRLHVLGVAPAPVPIRRLTPARVAASLDDVVRGPRSDAYARRAAELGRVMGSEDGVADTVRLLDRLGLL